VSVVKKKAIVKFAPRGVENFYDVLKEKVDDYFRTNNIEQHANMAMYAKTVSMLLIYFVPYVFIVTGLASVSLWLFYPLWVIMGIGIMGIGTGIMHDSNHGSYSTNDFINKTLGGLLNVIGGYAKNWRIQHNVLHHTFTNLDGLDEDIEGTILIRMSPNKPVLKIHRFQHIYAWVLYSLMNIFWVLVKDYRVIFRYHKNDLLRKEKTTLTKALLEVTFFKLFYFAYIIVLPVFFADVAWYHVVLGFVSMHLVAGLSLACIFQPAHVMETSTYPIPTEDRKIEHNWAVHQLLNTTNYAPGSRITAWFIGGLNYQIEHHLFPQVCHIHYPRIAGIVKSVSENYGLPYNVQPTFLKAIMEHGKMLKLLGRKTTPALAN
jgi:linoleoyl-CoA desaturase